MEWWHWVGGALLLTAASEAWSARLAARRIERQLEDLKLQVAELHRIIDYRMDEMGAEISSLGSELALRELSDIDPSIAP